MFASVAGSETMLESNTFDFELRCPPASCSVARDNGSSALWYAAGACLLLGARRRKRGGARSRPTADRA